MHENKNKKLHFVLLQTGNRNIVIIANDISV